MPFAPKSNSGVENAVSGGPVSQETMIDAAKGAAVAAGTQVAQEVLPEKAVKAVQYAQQASSIVTTARSLTGSDQPALPGINGTVPYEDLDTTTATEVAKSGQGKSTVKTSGADAQHDVSKVGANVSVNGTKINALYIQVEQSMGEHNRLTMTFRHDEVQRAGAMIMDGAEKLLGQVAEVELYDVNGLASSKLQNLFIITDIDFDQMLQNEGEITVHGYAPTWLLDGQPHFETFYKKTLNSIVKSVAEPSLSQVKAELKADATLTESIPYISRYNESVWNFLKRLSAETGQWLYFNGKELIFGKPEARSGSKIVYGGNCSQIQMSFRAKPLMQNMFDYEADTNNPITKPADKDDSSAGGYNDIAYKRSKELFGTIMSVANPHALPARDSLLEAIGRARSAQKVSDMYVVSGQSNAYELRVGVNADIDLKRRDQSASHVGIRITKIKHTWHVSGKYHNQFEGITATAQAPPPLQYQQPITSPMLAQVIETGEGKGRVRVQFMGWQQKEGIPETDYIRVLSPDAGNSDAVGQNRGLVTIPEIGDQVYVDFEAGNPDRPFIIGSTFHGSNGIGGGAANNIKSITMKNGSTITFDEEKKSITISDPSQNTVVMDGDGTINISSPKAINISSKDISITATNNITMNATASINAGANDIGVHATAGLGMSGADSSLSGGTTLSLSSPTTSMSGSADLKIEGGTVAMSGGADVSINGGLVKINS